MPYRFPRKLARSTDVPHPREFNQAWQPLAEIASGNLDAHNFDSGLTAIALEVGPHTFYKPYYVEVASNPGWGEPVLGYSPPTIAGLPASAHFVGQTANWGPVASMELTPTTGVSNLWIVFWCSYILHEFRETAVATEVQHAAEIGTSIVRGAGLQLALEVDGKILPDSITGFTEDWTRKFAAAKPQVQRDGTASGTIASDPLNVPGPVLQNSGYVQGVGPAAGAVRIVCNANVGPGAHTVRVVARTLQDYRLSLAVTDSDVGLAIHHRKLFVLDCPVFPASAPTRASVDVPSVVDGMELTETGLDTNRHMTVVDALNDITEGNVARGAFLNGHLPSTIEDSSTTSINGGPETILCYYPGYGTGPIAGAKAAGNTGWWWLDDGSAGPERLRTDDDASRGGAWTVNGGDKLFIILGNVQVHSIIGATSPSSPCHFAAFALAYKVTGGSTTIIGSTEAYVNNHIDRWYFAEGTYFADRQVEVDVPLFHVFNYSTVNGGAAPAHASVDYIGIVGSSFGLPDDNVGPSVTYERGNITVLELRG